MNPLDELFKWLPKVDFAVLEHRFAAHGRDYILLVEDCLGSDPGQHEIVFTHCVKAECETRVRGEVWRKSWSEEFADYERWTSVGEPAGMSGAQTGRSPIPYSGWFSIRLKRLNRTGDSANNV